MSTSAKSFIDGAMRGYQFIDGIYDKKRREQERQEDRELAKQYRQDQIDRDERRWKENREDRNAYRQSMLDVNQQRLGLAQSRNTRESELHNKKMAQYERMDKGMAAKGLFAKTSQAGYQLTDEDKEIAKELNIELDNLRDDGTKYNLNKLTHGIEDYLSGRNQDVINSPEFLGSFNKVFTKKINKNYGVGHTPNYYPGGQILKKEVSGIMPGKIPGTVVIDLLVTGKDKDGRPFQYNAPATVGRSTDGDEVKQIPVEHILGDIQTRHALASNDSEIDKLQMQLRGIMAESGINYGSSYSEPTKLGAGYVQYDSEGRAHPVSGASIGRGSNAPAIVKEIEYYMAHDKTFEQAVKMAKSGKGDGNLRASILNNLIKTNPRKSPEFIQEKAEVMFNLIKGSEPTKQQAAPKKEMDVKSFIESSL